MIHMFMLLIPNFHLPMLLVPSFTSRFYQKCSALLVFSTWSS